MELLKRLKSLFTRKGADPVRSAQAGVAETRQLKASADLDPDRPRTDPADDVLGYAPFAQHLASSVANMTPEDGVVIGLYGPWGSGKTTVLNFVEFYLRQLPETERPIIVHFNPWMFSGQEDLTFQFFKELAASLRLLRLQAAVDGIADYFEAAADVPLPGAGVGKIAAKLIKSPSSVHDKKIAIANELRKVSRRIVVVIDDIDRLSDNEVHAVFRLVKAVADFPNTIYLLAFDQKEVTRALSSGQSRPGELFLEKIIQVPFELPLPDRIALRGMFFAWLDRLLGTVNEKEFDRVRWGNMFLRGIDSFLTTPRAVTRICNSLWVTYPSVKSEVNAIDFIGIECVRVFLPKLYDEMRRNPEKFAGATERYERGSGNRSLEQLKKYHSELIAAVEEPTLREPVKELLSEVFPLVGWAHGGMGYGGDFYSGWRRAHRACSPDVFPVYFRLTLPAHEVSQRDVDEALGALGDTETISTLLLHARTISLPNGRTKASALLERLEDYTKDSIPLESIPSFIAALFRVADALDIPEDGPRATMDVFDNPLRLGRLIWQTARRLSLEQRVQVFRQSIEQSPSIGFVCREVGLFAQSLEKSPSRESEPLVDEATMVELRTLALQKVRAAGADGTLRALPSLAGVLYRWKDWAGLDEPKAWIQELVSSDEGFLILLRAFKQVVHSQGFEDAVGREIIRLDRKLIDECIDAEKANQMAKRLLAAESPESESRTLLEAFLNPRRDKWFDED